MSHIPWTGPPIDLPDDAIVEEIANVPAPPAEVGHGLASAEAIDLSRLTPAYTPVTLGARSGLFVQRWDFAACIFAVNAPSGELEVLGGVSHRHEPGDVSIDTRNEAAYLRTTTPEGSVYLEILRGGHLRAQLVATGTSALAPFLGARAAREVQVPTLPALASLLEGMSVPPWLEELYATGAEGGAFDRLAALGTVARLWTPGSRADRDVLRRWLMEGRGTSAARVADWLAVHVKDADACAVADEGVALAWGCREQLLSLNALRSSQGDEVAADVAAGLAIDRDELESALAASRLAGASDTLLARAVEAVDSTATASIDILRALLSNSRPSLRLRAAADETPSAWWASQERAR